jgi:hypothetical protein
MVFLRDLSSLIVAAALVAFVASPAETAQVPEEGAIVVPSAGPRPDAAAGDTRCTADGAHCIALATYTPDVCRTIEGTARANGLDPAFFARLIWRESLFAADALSPAGAEGIAQFMPGTAKLRGLSDAYNPAEALAASAAYLSDLIRDFGNIGLAATAYNGGETRAARFVAKEGGLAPETRAYVQAITGHPAEAWRDAPPEKVDLALKGEGAFEAVCIALAATRGKSGGDFEPPLKAWGVIVASNRDRAGAERQVTRLRNRFSDVLAGEEVRYARTRRPGLPGRIYAAQFGRDSRAEADAFCSSLRARGGDCMVLRN